MFVFRFLFYVKMSCKKTPNLQKFIPTKRYFILIPIKLWVLRQFKKGLVLPLLCRDILEFFTAPFSFFIRGYLKSRNLHNFY